MGLLLRFGSRLAPVTIAALAISLGAACNAQVATVLASDSDAATPPAASTPAGDSGSPTGTTTTTDGGPAPTDPSAFCKGSEARMSINGEDVPILDIKGKAIAMNCCDSAMLTIATGRFQALFNVLWRVAASRPTQPIDVATLTQGSGGLELDLGCDPSKQACATASPEDRFDSGFVGTIEYTPTSTGVDTSYCISVSEPAGSPHAVLHSVQIYVPTLASTY